ncbi:uncharacterized protein BDZ99DRAFT_67723 [Mytilinidion resinicola]|uniref:Uncharacterized protein n=1 Tax=Mytilinidion resinicola TaxID=574789 RepID=A0A6A6YH11_9PEZI|nr:uncharacterized protein BDZ99DRAFT_67723 [Mytilinidion resinicola]KAF2807868.1 hypothetical protein BDZ99DRAFT_67723 [Mytilinidion resinicola]
MPPIRPHLSITLPRSFTFHYTDGQPPKTPEPEERTENTQPPEPPEPPRQTYRVRRRRAVIPPYANQPDYPQESYEKPIPTIEGPIFTSDDFVGLPEPSPEPVEGFLAPAPSFARLMSPPKTPVRQVLGESRSGPHDWDDMDSFSRGDSISRPSSSCSGVSDSSVSSRNSVESFPSFGGSCTSPESDAADPFTYESSSMKYNLQSSPLDSYQQHNGQHPQQRKTVWTEELDNHLWMSYMRYLQDPTVTPFKMLPGTAPPLGVCHRVVRNAKQTWKGSRVHLASSGRSVPPVGGSGSPDTIKASKSGSNTPTGLNIPKSYPKWPRSDGPSRRRLRKLCKRKPSLSAHYQRLLHCRSPSPFPSSPRSSVEPAGGLSSPFSEHMASFSTRDMNISLSTSTASTMQYGNPLSQLTNDSTPRQEDWFNQPPARSSAHQKSQSLHFGLGLSNNMMGSSFSSMSQITRAPVASSTHEPHSTMPPPSLTQPPRLAPPVELHAPNPLPRSFKRRAFHQPSEDGRYRRDSRVNKALIQDLFGAPAESSHRRVRSRGFSLGDMGEGARRLSSMFTPPSELHQMTTQAMDEPVPTPESVPPHPTIRLGSPFGGRSSNVHFNNTFPRNFTPHGFEPVTSFEDRLGETSGGSSYVNSKDEMQTQN